MMTEQQSWATGDAFGLPMPADAAALAEGGEAWLTRAFHAYGALPAANRVARIERLAPFSVGGTGAKAMLDVSYAGPDPALPTALFVKFSRNFADPLRDANRHHMEPEVRLAALGRDPAFPIAIPRGLFADFQRASGTGMLLTERIAYGEGGIEPHYLKCMDQQLPDAAGHYRALVTALARLSGAHKAGRLPAGVAAAFPFSPEAALASDVLPHTPEQIDRRVARMAGFAADFPQLARGAIAAPGFLARFAEEAKTLVARQAEVRRGLNADPDMIALCHWNANIDNAWFWRNEPDGELRCGLMDWGSVGQMNLAMSLWGCLSGAEPALLEEELDRLIATFVREHAAAGGPRLDPDRLLAHLQFAAATMAFSWIMEAPARIRSAAPALGEVADRYDDRLTAHEDARVPFVIMLNYLDLWERRDLGARLRALPD